MAGWTKLFICLLNLIVGARASILCESGFCRVSTLAWRAYRDVNKTYEFETGCVAPAQECNINNATHTGMWMLSPTICNCCQFCLPLFGENQHCSLGGPGLGSTVGRCGDGLTCVADADGLSYCRRMESECHSAQDDYDARHEQGEVGALESRPLCDGKANYGVFDCVPTQTCFCQSEEGERIFGELLNLGASTAQNMHCGCSRLHSKIRKSIRSGVPFPVIGPRCTSDGNFNPVQCIYRVCYCVDRITGVIRQGESIDLDDKPLSELSCYDAALDLFPSQSEGAPPYNYTTPCFEDMKEKIAFIQESEQDGYIVDYFTEVPECLPDGTYGRVAKNRNGTRICVDQNGQQIDDYEALPNTQQYEDMDCKCAETSLHMQTSTERPICCKNGNFRAIQCRRGLCRCVDSDGRQIGTDSADVTDLPCFEQNWRDLDSIECYSKT